MVKMRKTFQERTEPTDLSLDAAVEYVVRIKKAEGLRARTLQDYRKFFGYFLDWLRENYDVVDEGKARQEPRKGSAAITGISDISTEVIRLYISYLREERPHPKTGNPGLSPYTINVRLRLFRSFFRCLKRDGKVKIDPTEPIKLLRTDEKPVTLLSDDEIYRLLNTPNPRTFAQFRDMVLMRVLLDTGMRIGESLALEVEDVNVREQMIILPAHKTKNRKHRVLPITGDTARLLLELVNENKVQFPNPSFIFLTDEGKQYRADSFRRRLIIYRDKAGIDKQVSPHALRKQFLVSFLRNGGNLLLAQKLLGHADLTTTRRYWDADSDDLRREHSKYSPLSANRK